MGTPTLGERGFTHPCSYCNIEQTYTDEDIDKYVSMISNTQLKHRIYEHELLIIATTPEAHKEAAMGVARDKLRQTFRKALQNNFEKHGRRIWVLLEDDAWHVWDSMRRILDNRVKRLKARWSKAKKQPWAAKSHSEMGLPMEPEGSHLNGPGKSEVA